MGSFCFAGSRPAGALVYGVPLEELFAGTRQEVEQRTRLRAKRLARKLRRAALDPASARKRRMLAAIGSPKPAEANTQT